MSIAEFAGCTVDIGIGGSVYPNSDANSGYTFESLPTGDGGDYTPRPLTPEEIAQMDDPSRPGYYGNVTNPILPEICDGNSGHSPRVVENSVRPASISYGFTSGMYILINDPPELKLTGEYVRGDFNKENVFHQEPGEIAPNVTSKLKRLPEKGALADSGYSSMNSPGQRALFKGNVNGDVNIVVSTVNKTGGSIRFALLFVASSPVNVQLSNRYGAVVGSGNCEELFITGNSPSTPYQGWNVSANQKFALFLARDSGDLNTHGPCGFSDNLSRAVNIPNDAKIEMHLQPRFSGEVQMSVVVFRDYSEIPPNIPVNLQYWGTYPFSRYSTGINTEVSGVTNDSYLGFYWEVDDDSGEGWLPVVVNSKRKYMWGTHALAKFPEPCPDNINENCAERYDYFYFMSMLGESETIVLDVKRADYTLPAYSAPTIPGAPAGPGSAWPHFAAPQVSTPCQVLGDCDWQHILGRDSRTPDIKYANLANWGVVYEETITFRNLGKRKRQFTYNFLDPTTGPFNAADNHRSVAVSVSAYIVTPNPPAPVEVETLAGARLIRTKSYSDPSTVFTVCVMPGGGADIVLRYVLSPGCAFGLLHNIQMRFAEKCESGVGGRWASED